MTMQTASVDILSPPPIAAEPSGELAWPVLETLAVAFAGCPHRIHINCDPNLSLSAPELTAVTTIVSEAISNAIEHGFPAGRQGDIWVRLTEGDGRLTLVVRDNGVGMPDLQDMAEGGRALIDALARQFNGYARLGSANFGGAEVLAVLRRAPLA